MSQSTSSSDSDSDSADFDPISLSQAPGGLPPPAQPAEDLSKPTPDTEPNTNEPVTAQPRADVIILPSDIPSDQPVILPPSKVSNDPGSSKGEDDEEVDDDEDDDIELDEVQAPDLLHDPAHLSAQDPQPHAKTSPGTAASRSWMSQRKGKAILIEGADHPMTDAKAEDEQIPGGNANSAQRIRDLGAVEEVGLP